MGRKKKILMYEMNCDKCGKDPMKDSDKSNENWTVIPMKCGCGGKIIIHYDKPYYVNDVSEALRKDK